MMNYRTKLLALGLSAAALSITLVLGVFLLPHGPYARRSRTVLMGFESAAVQRIEITRAPDSVLSGDAQFTLSRVVGVSTDALGSDDGDDERGDEDTQWRYMLEDELVPVRGDRIESFLDSLAMLERYRSVTSNTDLYDDLGFKAGGEDGVGGAVRLYDAQDQLLVDLTQGTTDVQRGVYARLYEREGGG